VAWSSLLLRLLRYQAVDEADAAATGHLSHRVLQVGVSRKHAPTLHGIAAASSWHRETVVIVAVAAWPRNVRE
jgi:hypothetical protein